MISSNYDASYGLTSGGVINAMTRAGTNQLHGSAYEFVRDEAFDARGFFDAEKLPLRRNQFGLAAGGPIVAPGTEVLTITPICPHSLTNRPVVVSKGADIRITYAGPSDISAAFLTVDGQKSVELELGDQVCISAAHEPLKLCPPNFSVFRVLATKLGWNQGNGEQ